MCVIIKLMHDLHDFGYQFDAIRNKQANIRWFSKVIKAKKGKNSDKKEDFEAKFVIWCRPKGYLGGRAVFEKNLNAWSCVYENSFFFFKSAPSIYLVQIWLYPCYNHFFSNMCDLEKDLVLAAIFNLSPKCYLPRKTLDSEIRYLSTYE